MQPFNTRRGHNELQAQSFFKSSISCFALLITMALILVVCIKSAHTSVDAGVRRGKSSESRSENHLISSSLSFESLPERENEIPNTWQKHQQHLSHESQKHHHYSKHHQQGQPHKSTTIATKMRHPLTETAPSSSSSTASTTALTTTATSASTTRDAGAHQHLVYSPSASASTTLSATAAKLTARSKRCALAERELDRCSAQLIGLGNAGGASAYPDNMQELNSVYCPRFRETVACVRNITANDTCYKPFERQIVNWILSSTRRMNYKRCKNENEKIRFLKLTNSCFSGMKNPMDDCMTRYISSLDGIADNFSLYRDLERLAENDVQIQLACCANMRFKQCIMRSAKQSCAPSHDSLIKLRRTNSVSSQRVARKQLLRVVQDTMEDLKSTLDEMALTGPDFICTGVDEHFCRTRFDGRYSSRVSHHKSIVPAMIKIYANK